MILRLIQICDTFALPAPIRKYVPSWLISPELLRDDLTSPIDPFYRIAPDRRPLQDLDLSLGKIRPDG
jgi:hypothetical protein